MRWRWWSTTSGVAVGTMLAAGAAAQRVLPTSPSPSTSRPSVKSAMPEQVAGSPWRDSLTVRTLDSAMTRAMRELRVPGGVLVAVRNGSVLASHAYGLADVEAQRAADANTTVFRIASVSKIFTAMAVLQLRDRGALNLDTDVRRELPEVNAGHAPLTLRQLLTHTAGLDERLVGYVTDFRVPAQSLATAVREAHPARVRDDRATPGYSNVGTAAAALIVERVSHRAFDQYTDSMIFAPLGMTHTGFVLPGVRPVPSSLAAEYRFSGARPPLTYSRTYPAGNIGTTASDMARLLVAWQMHTLPGLNAESYVLLDSALSYDDEMPPMGLALVATNVGGVRVLMKGGASRSHSALVARVPSERLDFFIAVNRQEPQVWERVVHTLADSLVRWDSSFIAPPASTSSRDAPTMSLSTTPEVNGHFRWTRAPARGYERVLGLVSQLVISSSGNGIRVRGPMLAGVYRHVGARRFVSDSGAELVVRVRDHAAETIFASVQGQPVSFVRVSWWERTAVQMGAWAFAVLVALASALIAVGRRVGTPAWRATVCVYALLHVLLLVAVVGIARSAEQLALGATPLLRASLSGTNALGIVACVLVLSAVRMVWSRGNRLPSVSLTGLPMLSALVAVSAAVSIAVLFVNDLLGAMA